MEDDPSEFYLIRETVEMESHPLDKLRSTEPIRMRKMDPHQQYGSTS